MIFNVILLMKCVLFFLSVPKRIEILTSLIYKLKKHNFVVLMKMLSFVAKIDGPSKSLNLFFIDEKYTILSWIFVLIFDNFVVLMKMLSFVVKIDGPSKGLNLFFIDEKYTILSWIFELIFDNFVVLLTICHFW